MARAIKNWPFLSLEEWFSIFTWNTQWLLTGNRKQKKLEKTELLLLSSLYRPSHSLEFVCVGGEAIQPFSSVRTSRKITSWEVDLGVILNPSADMEDHIKKICQTCSFHLTNISKIRTYLDRESTEAIIPAFVTTNLDYCDAIPYGLPEVLLNRLQLVQNRAACIVTFTKKYEHITPSLIDLYWLPVEYRIIYKILLVVYKAINGLSPSYISNLLRFCSSSYSLCSCSNKLLQVPRSKLKSYGDRSFSIAGPKLWNSVPTSLRNADSLDSFKKHLET